MDVVNAYIYIDALSWSIVSKSNFMPDIFGHRFEVKPQLGYAAAALSTVLSGEPPDRHGVFCDFYMDPEKSPFKNFRYLKYVFGAGLHPHCLLNRGWSRGFLSQNFARRHNYSGRFSLYRVPFDNLRFFDTVQKRDLLASRGLSPNDTIRDVLDASGIKFYMADCGNMRRGGLSGALKAIGGGAEFVFVAMGGLGDFLLESFGNEQGLAARLKEIRIGVLEIFDALKSSGKQCRLSVMSGFGMLPCSGTVDLKKAISKLELKYGEDYVAFFDPTMARFWYMNADSKNKIRELLSNSKYCGRFISESQKRACGISFKDCRFGEDIFLLNGGFQISPSYISLEPFRAVCGYSPELEGMNASFLSTREPRFIPATVADFFALMKSDAMESAGLG